MFFAPHHPTFQVLGAKHVSNPKSHLVYYSVCRPVHLPPYLRLQTSHGWKASHRTRATSPRSRFLRPRIQQDATSTACISVARMLSLAPHLWALNALQAWHAKASDARATRVMLVPCATGDISINKPTSSVCCCCVAFFSSLYCSQLPGDYMRPPPNVCSHVLHVLPRTVHYV